MKNIIENNLKKWNDMTNLKPDDYLINQHLYKLEQIDIAYSAKWGVDKLPRLVTSALADKWKAQNLKLAAAIRNKDHKAVIDLVNGYQRGYEALEVEAMRLGHVPAVPDVWDVSHDNGRVYRIVKNDIDAIRCMEDGVCVYTIKEVARILEGAQLVNHVKDVFQGAKVVKVVADINPVEELPF
jgi:hypothetical protein